jgi:uncharacterized protein (TIGR00369 family)
MSHRASSLEVEELVRAFEAQVPYNRVLGLRLLDVSATQSRVSFDMRDELVGNYTRGTLHGGVISATFDVVGGLVALMSIADDIEVDLVRRLAAIGTIDLRVDYLRPGTGEHFEATGSILRGGRKVAVTRMELHNDAGVLIAVGTGTYVVA